MTSLDLPYRAEYAKSGRASCKGCKGKIDQGALRLAVMVQSAFFDGKQANWFHETCFFQKQRPKSASDIAKLTTLRHPDQKRVKETIESLGSGVVMPAEKTAKGKGKKRAAAVTGAIKDFAVEYSKSSRATCRVCEIKICKDEVRISKTVFDTEIGQKYGGQALWHHVKCFAEDRASLLYLAGGDQLPGFKSLSKEDQAMVKDAIKPLKEDEVPVKKLKEEPKDVKEEKEEQILKKKIEDQNKLFYKYRDALQDYTKSQLHELLTYNNQQIRTGNDRCMDLIADCMAFGALKPCPKCENGQLVLDTHSYRCTGHLTEWTKCQNTTQKPERTAFKVPKKFKHDPFKKFKGKVTERVFESAPPPTTIVKTESELTAVKNERPPPPLKNLQFFIYGKTEVPKEDLKKQILKLGGSVATKLNENLAAVISSKKDVERMPKKMEEIQEKDIEVVESSYLDLIDKEKGTPSATLQLIKENNIASWGSDPMKRVPQDVIDGKSMPKSVSMYTKSGKSGPTKLKLKGGTAVDPDSNLEDVAHVFKDRDGTKWTVVLGLTDIVAQRNSYYKLQLLEADGRKKYWLFRSWGRIGTTIGGNKTEDCSSLDDAKTKFENLFFERTENDWFNIKNFTKVPGKMYPIDMDYGDDAQKTQKLEVDKNCKLPVPVQKLIMKLFDVDIMKRVMLEFELDTEKMPLGKLSKKQIKSGYKVLSELIEYIEKGKKAGVVDQDRIIDATNRFYTLVPHSFGVENPPLLSDEDSIKNKTLMLDNLMEIEIAYSMLTSESSEKGESPIENHYIKLKTQIEPLDRQTSEFEMLQKYVKNSHGATHSQYTLDIHEVYKVVRDSEDKRFKPFKKLHNRRLLWHGSRTTNFVGILSQGLRIAPPEAPVTGYMFGKGIYFADMVSKSANYCCTNKNDNIGVMLLCEVALGNMKECHGAEYVTSLPPGTHSVWGKGRTEPCDTQHHVLEDGTIVPLGVAKDISNRSTSLLYNEFIVYDVAQVKVKYLFEMKFNYKY